MTGRQNNWAKFLAMAEYAHNLWKHKVTKLSPHKMLFGIEPQVNVKFINDTNPTLVNRLQILDKAQKEAQIRLEALQKHKDDCKSRQLMQEDNIWLEAKNLVVKGFRKLLLKRYGPFKVLKHIGVVAYRLELLLIMKVYDVFNIDLLSFYKEMSSYGQNYIRPPLVLEENDKEYKIENI
jgi:hypothetical protein